MPSTTGKVAWAQCESKLLSYVTESHSDVEPTATACGGAVGRSAPHAPQAVLAASSLFTVNSYINQSSSSLPLSFPI